jgi:P-type Cu+ transporter
MITGEPVPVAKASRRQVVGGTINKTGAFTFRATKVGADTVLAQIIRMVEEAQGSKLPIQALVDKVTPGSCRRDGVAALTFCVWLDLRPGAGADLRARQRGRRADHRLPLRHGLATPTSIMVGTGRAAELGVLFRKGEALQSLRDARSSRSTRPAR